MLNTEQPFYVEYNVQELFDEWGEPVWINDAVLVLCTRSMEQELVESIKNTFPGAFSFYPCGNGELRQELSYHRSWPYDLTPDSLKAFIDNYNLTKQQ